MFQFSNFKFKIVLFLFTLFGQLNGQNLIPNGSFETYSSCPDYSSQIVNATPWFSINGSSDFHHNCSQVPMVGVPFNFAGSQAAYSGDGYAGIYSNSGSIINEYICVQLSETLEEGELCYFSFYVIMANISYHDVGNFGAYFSDSIITNCVGSSVSMSCYQPQIIDTTVITDNLNWTLISGSFVAEGGEDYVTIGHFGDSTETVYGSGFDYNYVDDVSLETTPFNSFTDTTICENISILFNVNSLSNDWIVSEYLWQDGTSDSTFLAEDEGIYWVDVLFENGSQLRDSFEIIYNNLEIQFLGNDTSLCDNETIYLSPNIDFESILWSDESTDSTLFVRDEGWYWAEIVLESGCIVLDSIYVNYGVPIALNLGNDTSICSSDSFLLTSPVSNAEFFWQDGSTDSLISISETGTYWMEIVDSNYCYIRDSIYIKVFDSPPIMNLLSDTTIEFCAGEELTIELPLLNVDYEWNNGDTSTIMNIEKAGVYWLEVSDSCKTYRDTMVVRGCRTEFVLPNAFSPNGDGLNDMFSPEFMANIAHGNLVVYNRWGMKLFETIDFSIGWDGTFKEIDCPMENYIWHVELTDYNGVPYFYKGNVVLVR